MGKWRCKLILLWRLFFTDHKHWIFISFNEESLVSLIKEESFEIDSVYHGLREYNVKKLFKMAANQIDDDQLILDKAEYEAKALFPHLRE